jgi:hypothetical protein
MLNQFGMPATGCFGVNHPAALRRSAVVRPKIVSFQWLEMSLMPPVDPARRSASDGRNRLGAGVRLVDVEGAPDYADLASGGKSASSAA